MSAICPECDSDIDIEEADVDVGDELTCSECGSVLRIVNDSPIEFEVADEDDLDDDEEDDDDEDENVEDDDEEFDEDEDEDGYTDEE
jgi:alpha-aminoadipate/glutamate carrier protein LysW